MFETDFVCNPFFRTPNQKPNPKQNRTAHSKRAKPSFLRHTSQPTVTSEDKQDLFDWTPFAMLFPNSENESPSQPPNTRSDSGNHGTTAVLSASTTLFETLRISLNPGESTRRCIHANYCAP